MTGTRLWGSAGSKPLGTSVCKGPEVGGSFRCLRRKKSQVAEVGEREEMGQSKPGMWTQGFVTG